MTREPTATEVFVVGWGTAWAVQAHAWALVLVGLGLLSWWAWSTWQRRWPLD